MSKKLIVTGASRGIGKAITQKLLDEGHIVIGIARSFDFEATNFKPIEIDLNDIKNLPNSLKLLSNEHPKIDGIICCSGKGKFGNLEEFSYDDISSLIDLNFISQVYLVKAFIPLLKKQQSGNLIFIGSEAALNGKRKGSIYCASKFALRGFAQAIRDECATHNVRVTIINPGMVNTSFFETLPFKPGDNFDEHILPEDIAKAVSMVLKSREGTVFDEINISPQKFKIEKKTTKVY